MIVEGYSADCYCEECENRRGEIELVGDSRADINREAKRYGAWISKQRKFFLCKKHNTKENRRKYNLKEKENSL